MGVEILILSAECIMLFFTSVNRLKMLSLNPYILTLCWLITIEIAEMDAENKTFRLEELI